MRYPHILILLCLLLSFSPAFAQPAPGNEAQLSGVADAADPTVASNSVGGFVVAWQAVADRTLQARAFDSTGTALAAARRLDDNLLDSQKAPDLAALGEDGFVVAWEGSNDASGNSLDQQIRARLLDAGGIPIGADLRVSETTQAQRPAVAAIPGGGFLVVWDTNSSPTIIRLRGQIHGQLFAADGTPIGDDFRIDDDQGVAASAPDVAVTSSGDYVVVWRSEELGVISGEDLAPIRARLLAPDGSPRGDSFRLQDDPIGRRFDPAVAATVEDGFLVIWTTDDSFGSAIRGRLFGPEGPRGGEQILSENPPGTFHLRAALGATTTGEFLATWRTLIDPGPGTGTVVLQGRALDSGSVPLGPSFSFGSTPGVASPSAVDITGAPGGYTVVWQRSSRAPGDDPRFTIRGRRFSTFPCEAGPETLCLGGGRFRVEVEWQDFEGRTGNGIGHPLTTDTGTFYFFSPDNLELAVKVLDGREINGFFWVFYGSLTNVEYTLTVTDTLTGNQRAYTNPLGQFGSDGDITALPGS